MDGFSWTGLLKLGIFVGLLTVPTSSIRYDRNILSGKLNITSGIFCRPCKFVVGLINSGLGSQLVLKKASVPLLPLCRSIINNIMKKNGDMMCDGLFDEYGLPIVEILADFVAGPTNICEKLRLCRTSEDLIGKSFNILKKLKEDEDKLFTPCTERINATLKSKTKKSKIAQIRHKVNRTQIDNSVKIFQVADIHFDPSYAEGAPIDCDMFICCRSIYEGSRPAGKYGSYTCDLPIITLDALLPALNGLNPDYIIYSGDSPPHDVWDESYYRQLQTDIFVLKRLRSNFGSTNIYPTLGNHETFPTNMYSPEYGPYQKFNKYTFDVWKTLFSPSDDERETMLKGLYYTTVLRTGLRLININTQFWYNLNFYVLLNRRSQSYKEHLQFIEDTLAQSRTSGEKVIISGHISPASVDSVLPWYGDIYYDIINRYSDIIVLQVYGHDHYDKFHLITPPNDLTDVKSVLFAAPALTTWSGGNPAARMYHLDPTTFELLDYDQYYMDLPAVNANNNVEIDLLYSAKDEYGLSDMSASSFYNLAKSFQSDGCLFQKYIENRLSHTSEQPDCDFFCKLNIICETRTASTKAYLRCLFGGLLRN